MAQSSRILDNVGRLMNDAAGVADGVRREVESMVRAQAERFVMDMDLVKREDYDALRELVQAQSAELKALKAEVAALKAAALRPPREDRRHLRHPRQPPRARGGARRYCAAEGRRRSSISATWSRGRSSPTGSPIS